MRHAALATLILLAPVPALAERFDLACEGTRIAERGGAPAPHATRLRIDTDARRWCQDDCASVRDIAEVRADALVLQNDQLLNSRGESSAEAEVALPALTLRQFNEVVRPEEQAAWATVEARCTRAPFTPFPVAR